jgi:hypothetical protein
VCMEGRRLLTWIQVEEEELHTALEKLQELTPCLAHQVQKKYAYRICVNNRHQDYLGWMMESEHWHSPRCAGKPKERGNVEVAGVVNDATPHGVNMPTGDRVQPAMPIHEQEKVNDAGAGPKHPDPGGIEIINNVIVFGV